MKPLIPVFLAVLALRAPVFAAEHAAPAEAAHATADHPAPAAAPAEHTAAPSDAHAAPATPAPEHPAPATAHVARPPSGPTAEELSSLLRIGDLKLEQKDWASAILAYNQILAAGSKAGAERERAALLGLARAQRGDHQLTKACAIYERYIKSYPDDDRLPVVYLELGRCLRVLGAHRLAIARFYSVINSTLKLPSDGSDNYRQLARTAQFEIAETYFQSGDYDQAHRFYSRLKLLDLSPADRARAAFKSAYSLNLKGDYDQTVAALRAYISSYPDGENAAEARNILAVSLRKLGRSQDSLAVTLDLLRSEQARTASDPKNWAYWQRKTGNQLANDFYEQGDIASALVIYQSLGELGGPPEWLLPVRYQIGLCQERLHRVDLARATYQSILDSLKTPAADNSRQPSILGDISSMVSWRLQHLDWLDSAEKRLMLFSRPGDVPSEPAPSAKPPASTS